VRDVFFDSKFLPAVWVPADSVAGLSKGYQDHPVRPEWSAEYWLKVSGVAEQPKTVSPAIRRYQETGKYTPRYVPRSR
jgi:hypothetical protein